jgi:uncharacterized protein
MPRLLRLLRLLPMFAPLSVATLGAQTAEGASYWNSSRHEVRSSVNHLNYQLFVTLPVGYSAKDTTRYPVLYVLDAPDNYWLVQIVTSFLGEGGATPRMILVGVGYPDSSSKSRRRRFDLTPTPERGTPTDPSGGAAEFLETFRRDFIPLIETTYRTRQDRALLGHSFGGLFAVYALFNAPELFHRYGILSPSMWWDDHRLLDELSRVRQPRIATAARAFVAAGADEDAGMRGEAASVAALLTRAFGSKLTLTSQQYPGNHQTYLPEAITPSLKFLYPLRACFESLPTVGQSYSVLSLPERVEIERFVRHGTEISGGAFQTGGPCFSYRLTSDAGGRVAAAYLEQNFASPRSTSVQVRGGVIHFETTDPVEKRSVDVSGPTSLFVLRFLGSIDPLVRMAPSRVGDSTLVQLSNFLRADGTSTGVVMRLSRDSVRVSHPRFDVRVHVSANLDMLGGTTKVRTPEGVVMPWVVVRSQ